MADSLLQSSLDIVVKEGDTLWTLAQDFGVPWEDIQSSNGLQDHFIFPGDVLKVPIPVIQSRRHSLQKVRTRPWIVSPGDTAWDISQKVGIPFEDLLSVNPSLPEVLVPGDVLQVPQNWGSCRRLKEVKARIKGKPSFSNANFFDVFPPDRDVDEYRLKYRVLLNALRHVESSFIMPAPTGDGGLSIGPLQISSAYHTDAWSYAHEDAKYEDCEDLEYAERTVIKYWLRYCPWAVEFGDIETLARTHNGGPQYWHNLSTVRYMRRVRRGLKKFGRRQEFPAFRHNPNERSMMLLLSWHIPSPVPFLDGRLCNLSSILAGSLAPKRVATDGTMTETTHEESKDGCI